MKKFVKKVISVGVGVGMAASALTGALAYDLSDYPAPFVKNGQFDALIAIGQQAKSDDVLGAVDIATGLQFAMKKEKTISTGLPTATTTSGAKIEKTGNHLNLGEDLEEVQATALSDSDLPDILADGVFRDNKGDNFNEETYTQRLYLLNNSGQFMFEQPNSQIKRDANTYLEFDNSYPVYKFQLDFNSPIEYNNATQADIKKDLENNIIEIQGHDYTITKVQGTGKLDKMTLFAGDTIIWLTQNQQITKAIDGVDHTIEVYDVTEQADSCGIIVDGSLVWVDKGTTEIVNGLEVGITDAKTVHAQLQDVDVCQVNIGASKIELANGEKIKKDGKDISGSKAWLLGDGGKWAGFNMTYMPKKDMYLAPGEAFTDPVLDGFKIQYAGNAEQTENITIDKTGNDRFELTFNNNDNKEVVVPFTVNHNSWTDANGMLPGSDWNELMLWKNGQTISDPNGVEGTQLLAVTSGKETHVLQIAGLDTTDNTTDIEDLTYGRTYSSKDVNFGTATPIELSGIGTVSLTFTSDGKNLTANNIVLTSSDIETKYGAGIVIDVPGASTTFVVDENSQMVQGADGLNATIDLIEKSQPSSEDFATTWRVSSSVDAGSDEIDLTQPMNVSAQSPLWQISFKDGKADNSDIQVARSFHGTKATYNAQNKDYVKFEYPEDQMFGQVFVTPISAEVTQTGGDIKTVDLTKLNVGVAKFDTDIADVGLQNLIVVGGPCVNRVAAELAGVSFGGKDCADGFNNNEALMKLYETGNGKVALLVAGMNGLDTMAASRVLNNYDVYKNQLKGDEVRITYSSLSQITVSEPR